jgi:hypothetical protein
VRRRGCGICHPETAASKDGGPGGNQHTVARRQLGDGQTKRFTADTAAKTGKSERAVQLEAERREKIAEQATASLMAVSTSYSPAPASLRHLARPRLYTPKLSKVCTVLVRRPPGASRAINTHGGMP